MDDEIKKGFEQVMVQVEATKLIANEALAVAIVRDKNPKSAMTLARADIKQIGDLAKQAATVRGASEWQLSVIDQVQIAAKQLLDAVEKRVSGLMPSATSH